MPDGANSRFSSGPVDFNFSFVLPDLQFYLLSFGLFFWLYHILVWSVLHFSSSVLAFSFPFSHAFPNLGRFRPQCRKNSRKMPQLRPFVSAPFAVLICLNRGGSENNYSWIDGLPEAQPLAFTTADNFLFSPNAELLLSMPATLMTKPLWPELNSRLKANPWSNWI